MALILYSKKPWNFNCNKNREVIWSLAHSHHGSKVTVAAIKIQATLKDKVSTNQGAPTQLLTDHTTNVPIEVRAAIGQYDSVKHSVCSEKAKAFPTDPQSHLI